MKTLNEILNFFRENECQIELFGSCNYPTFTIWCKVRKIELFDGNEYQLRNFYDQINK